MYVDTQFCIVFLYPYSFCIFCAVFCECMCLELQLDVQISLWITEESGVYLSTQGRKVSRLSCTHASSQLTSLSLFKGFCGFPMWSNLKSFKLSKRQLRNIWFKSIWSVLFVWQWLASQSFTNRFEILWNNETAVLHNILYVVWKSHPTMDC